MYVDVGHNNFVAIHKIISVSRCDSAPVKRMVRESKDKNKYVDLTQGKKTRSIIVTAGETNDLIIIATTVQTNTIISRIKKLQDDHLKKDFYVIGEGEHKEEPI